jgi:hypothetical protein
VFVAGLPGTGKSLVVHQLTHLATAAGRCVHLLQWDVARPVIETSAAGRRHPGADGVTHPMVRKAVGLWARGAIAGWAGRHAGSADVLIGETPLVGNRLVELTRPAADAAEAVLGAPSCRFVIVVPSVEVRRFVEAERERRAAAPRHPREREDAPPAVLRALWAELARAAGELGLAGAADARAYDPALYRRVYEALLRRRHVEVLALDDVLPTHDVSVYDCAGPPRDVVPDTAEAEAAVRAAEAAYPDPRALAREVDRWWSA